MNATRAFAFVAAAVVLAGILTAWADPVAGHWLNAIALMVGSAWLILNGPAGGAHWLLVPLLWASTWGVLQLAFGWTIDRYETWSAVTGWLARSACFYLAFTTLKQRRMRNLVLSVFLVAGALLSVVGMLEWFTAHGRVLWLFQSPYQDEVMGTFLNRDHYAVFAELVLPIALTVALSSDPARFPAALAAAFIYASVVITGSRAGTIWVSAEALLMVGAVWRQTREYRLALAVAAGLALCSIAVGWEYVWFRFQAADPFAFRREMAASSLDMIRTRPLTGFGLGTWPVVYPAFAQFDPPGFFMNHAHNDWLEWIADGGLPMALAVFPVVVGAVAHAAVDFPMQKPALAALTFFLLGAAAAAARTPKPYNFRMKLRESEQICP
jgi:O-antigen ligase